MKKTIELEMFQIIQRALGKRFGTAVNTDTGAATLSIAHDRMEMTDKDNLVIACDAETVIAKLADGASLVNITVTLDDLSSKLVRWYAEENAREVSDVVNGVVAGELAHLREEIEGGYQDDTHLHIAEYITEAIARRRIAEGRWSPQANTAN